MDYKNLLIKYMNRVGHEEGTYFLPGTGGKCKLTSFTQDEVNELQELSCMADALADQEHAFWKQYRKDRAAGLIHDDDFWWCSCGNILAPGRNLCSMCRPAGSIQTEKVWPVRH